MKTFILIILATILGFLIGILFQTQILRKITPPKIVQKIIEKPLEKYTIENLSKANISKTQIEIGEVLKETEGFTSYLFSFQFDPTLQNKKSKKITGLLNVPKSNLPNQKFPLIVMMRGYVDREIYTTGEGTRRSAEIYSQNGFLTIAPDFLGYAGSDLEEGGVFETRFQTYTTILTLLSSLDSISQWDSQNIFLWGHSNGGQIALSILEITGRAYPTTLWAPVSQPFPFSILYYTNEAEDKGKVLRASLAKFESLYDADLYSIHKYFHFINKDTPLQIHQGELDEAVPQSWSNELVKTLKDLGLKPVYFVYPQTNHNFQPNWNTVVLRDLEFFKKNLNY